MKLISLTPLLAGMVMLGSPLVNATVITPDSVQASSSFGSDYDVSNLINDSGMFNGLHDTTEENMWLSKEYDTKSILTFGFKKAKKLRGAYIWQYNPSFGGVWSGLKMFNIFTSLDNAVFNLAAKATLTPAAGNEAVAAQYIDFNKDYENIKYVRFANVANFGDTYNGLSEVKFETAAFTDNGMLFETAQLLENDPAIDTGASIPEPNVISLLAMAILGGCLVHAKFSNA